MLKNFLTKTKLLVCHNLPQVMSFAMVLCVLACGSTAFAANDAENLMTAIVKLLAALVTVLGAVFAIMGLIHYAAANSEGDGPAKQKAVMQIASGGMLILLSILLSSNAKTLAGYIADDVKV